MTELLQTNSFISKDIVLSPAFTTTSTYMIWGRLIPLIARSVNAVDQLVALSRDTLVIFVASSIRNILALGSLEVRVK